ncbi:Coiled-coil domain-containing protein 84 [Nymphon striatum]|nr:Coiled-coil domain-containing protein 84 [Nymphon striatum]
MELDYCEFCKTSHSRGKNHVYSKRHRLIVDRILQKFSNKIKEALDISKKPEIYNQSWETGAKFWCYFCATEFAKHVVTEEMCIKDQGLLHHFTESTHHHCTHTFWWNHRLSKNKINSYKIEEKVYVRYLKLLEEEKNAYQMKQTEENMKVMVKIKQMDAKRNNLVQITQQSSELVSHQLYESKPAIKEEKLVARALYNRSDATFIGRRPATVYLLHCVGSIEFYYIRPKSAKKTDRRNGNSIGQEGCDCRMEGSYLSNEQGNIHTGAKPPWLIDEDEKQVNGKEIGPTLRDFEQHLKQEKKKKLNPNRVGANFDHNAPTSSDWLPSFGRVWNMGRRWQSRYNNDKMQFSFFLFFFFFLEDCNT